MKKYIEIRTDHSIDTVFNILKGISNSYIVGGYIRDFLLGEVSNDCDFTTSASLEEVIAAFSNSNFSIDIISEKLNIIKVKYMDRKFEIARLRKDIEYFSNRKDFSFNFVDSIEVDLQRRDFTVNAFAYDGKQLIYVDSNSLDDIKNKKLRFIGDTETKILEDPFRMLRLFRFFSEKNFSSIDEITLEKIKKHKNLIWTLPKEMIQNELISIIKGKNYLNTFMILNEINFFNEIFVIEDFKENYKDRVFSLFKNSDLALLKKLNFSKKILSKLENKII